MKKLTLDEMRAVKFTAYRENKIANAQTVTVGEIVDALVQWEQGEGKEYAECWVFQRRYRYFLSVSFLGGVSFDEKDYLALDTLVHGTYCEAV